MVLRTVAHRIGSLRKRKPAAATYGSILQGYLLPYLPEIATLFHEAQNLDYLSEHFAL